jgi:predicted permease
MKIGLAIRTLARSPGFATIAILTLALGIGANTAIFSVVQGVLLAPLPFAQPERLVTVRENSMALKREMSVSYPDFHDWQIRAGSFQEMAAVRYLGFDLTSPGTPEHVDGHQISAGFFSTLGVKLTLGREFSPEEDRPNGAPVVIISDRLWKNRFAANPNALGMPVILDGVGYTIVGILPSDFQLWISANDADVYTPLSQGNPFFINDRTVHSGIVSIARLKPRVTVAQASAEMSAMESGLRQIYPAADRGVEADVIPLKQEIVGDARQTLLLLLGAVGLVLLIACANVANLLLARSVARTREFAIRLALGAGRARIVRQLVSESVLLSLAGGVLGLVVAKWAMSPALTAMAGALPRGGKIGVNIPVLVFTFAVSMVVGILFGLVPALKGANTDLQPALKEGTRGSAGGQHRAQGVLVVVQMALTLVLLTGASLLFRTIHNLWQANPGFDTQHLITFKVGLSPAASRTGAATRATYQQLIGRIRQIPGVEAADLTTLVPLSQSSNAGPFWIGNVEPNYVSEAPRALYYETGPDYLRAMGLPLLRGRFFTPEDTTVSEPVIVIDSVLARTYFPNRNPVGQTITVGHWRSARIIGVVAHVRHWGLGDPDLYTQNQIYISFYQLPDESVPLFRGNITLIVRTPLDAAAMADAIKPVVYGVDNGQPIYSIRTMPEIVARSMTSERFIMILLGAFAVLALLLATVGIYGVISYSMSRRVREIGIRMALGAEKKDVLLGVINQGLRLAVTGVAIGAVAAVMLTRVLASFSHLLYGVQAEDPLTFLAVALVLIGAAVLACYVPARRAAKVDPIVALRYE